MSGTNDFQPFAVATGANVLTQAAYLALSALPTGFQSGVAQSAALNKVWRQSSIMSAMLGQLIVDQTGQNATDDGTIATLETNLVAAIRNIIRQKSVLTDTGTANAYVASNTPPLTALPSSGFVQVVNITHTNTGASTYAPDGLAAKPVYGLGLSVLQGGELTANGVATLMYLIAAGVNSGNGAWIIVECTGGAQQIPAATQSNHAMQLGQATGRLLRTTVYTIISGVQQVSVNGGAFTTTSASTFTSLATTSTVVTEGVGGGGSGGGSPACSSSQATGGAGGGAGSYFKALLTSGFSGGIAITIGAAGIGASGVAGTSGGATSFGAIASAPGGGFGTAGSATTVFPQIVGYGAGGATATGGNIINAAGGFGASAFALGTSSAISGSGGASVFGGGGSAKINVSAAGNVGSSPGSGGSGALTMASGSAQTGGNGAPGQIIVYEFS